MSDVLEFSYRVGGGKLLLMLLACTASAIVLCYFAGTNDRELVLNGIPMSRGTATFFTWSMAAVSGWIALQAARGLASGVASRLHTIRLTPAEFSAPKGFFLRTPVTVPLRDIRKMRVHSANGTRYLNVKTALGRININRSEVGAAAFDALCATLDGYLKAQRQAR
ncbi:MAG: hypothetical protein OEO83_19315 [Alphaproteobacteria bacterium]|nr:hypothetical protein [Alphaproteobacteria bacterium]